MKIDEVRTLLDQYSEDQLRLIIAEMYKAVPKKVKEDKEIDSLLNAPEQFKKSKTAQPKKKPIPDIEMVVWDAEEFIENAYNQYYFAPNSVVPKRERPKWRFTARRLYKDLLAAAGDETQLQLASDLLKQLYVLLCYSCSYILFSADNPFRSVGVDQQTFLQSVLTLRKRSLSQKDFSMEAVSLVVDNSVDPETLTTDLMNVAIEFFPTPDAKEAVLEACDELIKQKHKMPERREHLSTDQQLISKTYRLQSLAEMAFLFCAGLHEFERGIAYLQSKNIFARAETRLYIILKYLFDFEQKELFIKEYENAVNQGIKPRECLTESYNTLRQTGEFPEHL